MAVGGMDRCALPVLVALVIGDAVEGIMVVGSARPPVATIAEAGVIDGLDIGQRAVDTLLFGHQAAAGSEAGWGR